MNFPFSDYVKFIFCFLLIYDLGALTAIKKKKGMAHQINGPIFTTSILNSLMDQLKWSGF